MNATPDIAQLSRTVCACAARLRDLTCTQQAPANEFVLECIAGVATLATTFSSKLAGWKEFQHALMCATAAIVAMDEILSSLQGSSEVGTAVLVL